MKHSSKFMNLINKDAGKLDRKLLAAYSLFTQEPETWVERLQKARPQGEQTDVQKHLRNVAILQAYWTTNATLDELAHEHGLSRESIRMTTRRYLLLVHEMEQHSAQARKEAA
jgi:hypothetical protein